MPVLEYTKSGNPGVSKTTKVEGTGGQPKMADWVLVKYSGYRDDGRVECESGSRQVRLGLRELWGTGADLGLFAMNVGERALITLEEEFSGLEPGAKLTLDLTLLSIVDPSTIASRECYWFVFFIACFTLLVAYVHFKLHII